MITTRANGLDSWAKVVLPRSRGLYFPAPVDGAPNGGRRSSGELFVASILTGSPSGSTSTPRSSTLHLPGVGRGMKKDKDLWVRSI